MKVSEIAGIRLMSEFLPNYDTVYIPCTWIDESYEEYIGAFAIEHGIVSIKSVGGTRTTGWIKINGVFVNKI